MKNKDRLLSEKEKMLEDLEIENKLKELDIPFEKSKNGLSIHIPFIDEVITLTIPSFSFKREKKGVTISEKILLLNYLIYAKGSLSGEWIEFKRLFCKKERDLLKNLYLGLITEEALIKKAMISLGAKELEPSSFIIEILPKLPVFFKLRGDLNIFFDSLFESYEKRTDLLSFTKILSRKILKKAKIFYEEATF